MKVGWLEETDGRAVSDVATRVLESRGAIVDEHTASHVAFEGLDLDALAGAPAADAADRTSFERGGVLTLVQPTGERQVEVRVRVRARIPARVFWTTLWIGLATAIGAFVVGLTGSQWVALGALLWMAFLATGLVYLGTFRGSWAAEAALLDLVLAAATADGAAARSLTEEQRLRASAEEQVEAKLLERRLQDAKPEGRPKEL